MFSPQVISRFKGYETPFYYYDLSLLNETIKACKKASLPSYHIHYALKANANTKILKHFKDAGFGADCVSGNEVKKALDCGFKPEQVVFAGVGKSDTEINLAIKAGIFCFNVESSSELEVINQLAEAQGKKVSVALRINPNVDAHTHKYITTGLEENKFGINPHEFESILSLIKYLNSVNLIGLHFHIGSQITSLTPYKNLCLRVNEINQWFAEKGYLLTHINVGGGLGINYMEPDKESIPDFQSFFNVFKTFLELRPGQHLHFELGRALVANCGNLISRVLYIKKGINTNFAILDAGMTELIRPALYQAYHKIENLTSPTESNYKYDVVGPICESSDCFGKAVMLPETNRGDIIAIRSAGAYGEVMSNRYNLRDEVKAYFSD